MRLITSKRLITKTILGTITLFVYCEYLIYYVELSRCDWPSLDPQNEDQSVQKSKEDPVRVMVLADTHLLGSRHGHWFDKLRREWQMHRTFQTAMTLHSPDLVFVLGDLTDEGLYCGKAEFEYYVKRFHSLFAVPNGTRMYVAVGNHDIGFHYSITPYLNSRFVNGFNSTAIQLISERGVHFVLVNSMALEGDGCFLCKAAERQLTQIEKILKCSSGQDTLNCDLKSKLDIYSRPILMQHYPLYRENDLDCTDFDAAPEPIKSQRYREKWDCLSKEATYQLIRQIKPRVALSGHTHHGCTRPLPNGDGVEITIPSFSWRNKNNPTYGLAVFTTNNYAFYRCAMPKESIVVNLYIFLGSILLLLLIYIIFTSITKSKRKHKLH